MQLDARLRAFAAVARQGSFSRAAAEIFVSQPAVSKHIASLERELGSPLVQRSRSGTTLTPKGRLLADYVLRAEAMLANAQRAVTAVDGDTGTVTVAASGIPGDYLLPAVLGRFLQRHPRVDVAVRVTTSGHALELVRAHEVELAVVGGFNAPADLETEPLAEDEIVLVGPPELRGRRLRARDLARFTWIEREEGSSTRAAIEAARWQMGIHEVRTLELTSWEAIKATVAAGGGVTAISRFAIERELASGALVVLEVPRWQVRRTIAIVSARDVRLTPPAVRFREALRDIEVRAEHARVSTDDRLDEVLAGLTVFAGGFEADAAEYVCDADVAMLDQLIDRGLLTRNGRRFTCTDERRAPVDQETARRHAEFYVSLVEESDAHLSRLGQDEWTRRLERECDNVDVVLRWAGAHKEPELVLRVLGSAWRFWLSRGYPDEWKRLLSEAVDSVTDPQLRLRGLPPLGWLALSAGELDRAETLAAERIRLGSETGDDLSVVGGLTMLSALAEMRGDLDSARRFAEEAVALDRRAGDDARLSEHLTNLSQQLFLAGDLDAADAAAREAAALGLARGDDTVVANAVFQSAEVALAQGEPARALELARASLPQLVEHLSWRALEVAGAALVGIGAADGGVQLMTASERTRAKRAETRSAPLATLRESALDAARNALGPDAFGRARRRGARLTHQQALDLVARASSTR